MTTPKFQQKYRVPSARATWHDYNGGMYFVTICTKDKIGYLGKVLDGKMQLNGLGKFTETCMADVSNHFPDAKIPVFVIMPNHIHLIVCIDGDNNTQDVDSAGDCRDAIYDVSTVGKNQQMKAIADKFS